MTVHFDMTEVNTLARDLAAAAPVAEAVATAARRVAAAHVRDSARADVAVRSGDTRDSIHVNPGDDFDEIVADDEAAYYLEFGTSDTAPQPFMWPQAPKAALMIEAAVHRIDPLD